MRVEVRRFGSSPAGTPGMLRVYEDDGGPVVFSCYTVEQPWLFNAKELSCIPIGEYTLRLDRFNKGGYDAYEVDGVPGRSEIKIHVGNSIVDILGCIVLGETLGIHPADDLWWLVASKKAFEKFMGHMRGVRTATLTIQNAYSIQEGELYEVQ